AGIVILLNVVVHAQLSTPSPFRIFVTDPPVTFIGYWPYILLPGFLVPLAWLLHATSLIQLRRSRVSLVPRNSYQRGRGSENVKAEPRPGWLFAQIFPPCSSTTFRQSPSPSPV